jgi:hypothetical protein
MLPRRVCGILITCTRARVGQTVRLVVNDRSDLVCEQIAVPAFFDISLPPWIAAL